MNPTPELRLQLRAILADTSEPFRFSDDQLDAMLRASTSLAYAAYLGWTATIMYFSDPNRLIRASIGSETLQWPDMKDLIAWARGQADYWAGQLGIGVGRILAAAEPCWWGIRGGGGGCGPGGPSPNWAIDLTRLYGQAFEVLAMPCPPWPAMTATLDADDLEAGPPGPPGQSGVRWFTGPTDPPANYPGANPGDRYLNTVTGSVWEFIGGQFRLPVRETRYSGTEEAASCP